MAASSPVWLFLAATATAYLTFLLTQLAQQTLPALLASWQGRVLLEEVRVSALGISAISGGFQAPRGLLADLPTLFGVMLTALGWFWASRTKNVAALAGYHLAVWNLMLITGNAAVTLLAGRRSAMAWVVAVAGAPLLVLLLRSLTQSGARYFTSRFARLEAALCCFLAPFLILMVLFWRVNFRLPVRGPQTVALMLGAIGVLIVLALAAAGLARPPAEKASFPSRSAWRAAGLATVVLAVLVAYGQVQNWMADRGLARAESAHYELLYSSDFYSPGFISALLQERESRWPGMQQRLAAVFGPAEPDRLRVRLFPTLESKYRRTRSTLPETVTGSEIFAVVNAEHPRWSPQADGEALLATAWSTRPQLEFLTTATAGYIAGPDLAEVGRIVAEEGPYPLARLTNPDVFISPLVRRPLAAAFAAWIGPEQTRLLYRFGSSGDDWRPSLEEGWRQYQVRLSMAVHLPPHIPSLRWTFYKGVAFSHEGGMRSGGYASERAATALHELAGMGVDSVSLMPFGFMSAPDSPALRMFTGESDESLDHMTWAAHQAGLRVMLKPQIWLRGGRFSGDVRFSSEEDFQTWWRAYRQWILHYARLAQRNGTDMLCVGTEFQQISSRQADWRRLIAEIRRVYHGPLTYAANWGHEFEEIEFWDALNYMGLNNYYPLADSDSDTAPDRLKARAEQVAQRVAAVQEKWKRPVILTEVGYPSQVAGARQPWREDFSGRPDPELQARLYQAVFQAFYHQPWCAGMYWWKWPSSGFGGGLDDPGLTPLNKPAAQVLQAWFKGNRP